jgi:hypothetical protein
MAVPAILGGITVGSDLLELFTRDPFSDRLQGPIMFPPDLSSRNIPFMAMEFKKYQRRSINEQPFYRGLGKILLPIPENLLETTSVTYNKEALGSAIGAATEALSGVTGISGDPGTIANNLFDRLTTAGTGAAVGGLSAIVSGLARGAAETLGVDVPGLVRQGTNALSALSGITTNPFEVMLFKSPDFRKHTFAWNFVATTLQESELLSQLIETIKYHSLPGISSAGAVFFSYPEIIEIRFRPDDKYLYKFKPCVVDSVRVNYAPNKPSFVKSSGAPTAIQLQINLQEIEIMTKADFLRDASGVYRARTGGVLERLGGTTPEQRAAGQQRFGNRALLAPGGQGQ